MIQIVLGVVIFAVEGNSTIVLFINSLLLSLMLKNRREKRQISLGKSQNHKPETCKTNKRASEPTERRYNYR